jgi:hypothetical protein
VTTIKDKYLYFFIVLASLFIYTPYIQSFDYYQDCRYYQSGDSWWYEEIVISIIQDHDLNMANNIDEKIHHSGQLAMSIEGYLAPKHSIFFAIATIPFYLIFGPIGAMYFNLFLIVLLNLLVYAINRMFFNKTVSLITTFLFATGTIIMSYSFNYLAEVFSTVLLAAGVLFILRKNYSLAAIILGFSCFAKVSNAPWVGIMFLYILWNSFQANKDLSLKERMLLIAPNYSMLILIFFISLIPVFVTNYFLYGGILTTGYHRTVSLDENYNLIILNGASGFSQGFWEGLKNILFHPELGLIEANPIILVSMVGILMFKKMTQKPFAIMFMIIILGQFLLFAKWDMWYATEFGNRFLMFSIVLFSPFTGNIINLLIERFSEKTD